jgi:hypothetical protein
MDALKQLQELLHELFQLDFADLDFGLYRLLHIKRNEIEAFLSEQLSGSCKEAFQGVATEENTNIAKELSGLAKRIRNEIADDALLENGDLNPDYRKTKVDPAVERRFLESKIKSERPFNEILINGDTATPGIKSLDGIFKRPVDGV